MSQKGFVVMPVLISVLVTILVLFLIYKADLIPATTNLGNNPIVQDEPNKTLVEIKNINMDLDTWVVYKAKIPWAYNEEDRDISFKYPKELYLKDFSTSNGTIWIQREPPEYKYATSVDIEIGRGQLKGEFSPTEKGVIRTDVEGGKYKIRKAELQYSGEPANTYGVIYYFGNIESYDDSDMKIYLSFNSTYGHFSDEEEQILKNVTEEIAKSFTFID